MSAGSAIRRRPCQLLNPIIVSKMSMSFSRSWRQFKLLFKAKQNLWMHNMSRALYTVATLSQRKLLYTAGLSGHFIRHSDRPHANSESKYHMAASQRTWRKQLADVQVSIRTGKEEDFSDFGRGDRGCRCQMSCRSERITNCCWDFHNITTITNITEKGHKKEKSFSVQQLCGDRCLIGVMGSEVKMCSLLGHHRKIIFGTLLPACCAESA